MLAPDRHRQILRHLERDGAISLGALQRSLGVTKMTVWRDLKLLEAGGRLVRVHGGAVHPSRTQEPAFQQKQHRRTLAKQRIAAEAARRFVTAGDVLFLEGGTTVAELVPHLAAQDVTLITNSLPIAERARELNGDAPAVQCSGGTLSRVSGNCVGPDAVRFFERKRARTFFMSATGLDLESGRLTDPNPAEIEIKRAMARGAGRIVLLLDASKLGVLSVDEVLPLSEIDAIVTDARLAPKLRRRLRALGPDVFVA